MLRNNIKMKRILITGASGFLGYPTLLKVSETFKQAEIFALYNNRPIKKINNIVPIKIDLSLENELIKLPGSYDAVIHFAGLKNSFLKNSAGKKQLEYNTRITTFLGEHMTNADCKHIIFASSVYIYSGIVEYPFIENKLNIPSEYLGLSKFLCELILKGYYLNSCLNVLNLRIFTVYGQNLDSQQFVSTVINKLKSKTQKEIFYNPKIKRDFIHIDDVVQSFILGLKYIEKKEKYFDSINVATGISTSIEDIIKIIENLLHSNKDIKFGNNIKFAEDTDHIANIDKMKRLLKWSPQVGLLDGLKTITQ